MMKILQKVLIEDERLEDFITTRGIRKVAQEVGVSDAYLYSVFQGRPMSEKVYNKIVKLRDEQERISQL